MLVLLVDPFLFTTVHDPVSSYLFWFVAHPVGLFLVFFSSSQKNQVSCVIYHTACIFCLSSTFSLPLVVALWLNLMPTALWGDLSMLSVWQFYYLALGLSIWAVGINIPWPHSPLPSVVFFLSTLDVSLSSLNMYLMFSSKVMFFSLKFTAVL